jgi:hypothetical protein
VCLGEGGLVRGSTNVSAVIGDKDVCALAGHRDALKLFEITRVLMRFVHVALLIVNADHCGVRAVPTRYSGVA